MKNMTFLAPLCAFVNRQPAKANKKTTMKRIKERRKT
jgi:hypothetical protein